MRTARRCEMTKTLLHVGAERRRRRVRGIGAERVVIDSMKRPGLKWCVYH